MPTESDTTAQALATLREWDNEPDLQRALDSIEARIATLTEERDAVRNVLLESERDATLALARAEQAERERDEALRLRSGSEWGAMAARITQLEAALREATDLLLRWKKSRSFANAPLDAVTHSFIARAISTEGEPAEKEKCSRCSQPKDRPGAFGPRHDPWSVLCYHGHPTPKED